MIIGEDSGFITVKSLHNHVKMALINIFSINWEIYHFRSDLTGSKYQKGTVVNFNSNLETAGSLTFFEDDLKLDSKAI